MAITLTPHDDWNTFQCDCVWQNGVQIVGTCEGVCNIPTGYLTGRKPPNYPVPAIPLAVKYDYVGCVNIDDVSDENDPVIVWMYDSWTQLNV